jgi:hypothetical protein
MNKKLFLSAVSREFEDHRQLLAQDLKRPTLDVAVQEDFGVLDDTTLGKLDTYIRACHGVVHLIGKATGECPKKTAVVELKARYPDLADKLPALAPQLALDDPGFSYTQWEAYLALYHHRPIFFYIPADFSSSATPPTACTCTRSARFVYSEDEERSQQAHYRRISDLCRDRGTFLNSERLSSAVLRDLVEILPALESRIHVPPTKLRHTAEQLIGRDNELTLLDEAWADSHRNVIVIRGKGGEGKTSLVASWMAELAYKDWRGAEGVLDWSFYSQGTRDQSSATAEFFIRDALGTLGDPSPDAGDPNSKAERLAKLIGGKRYLLVLDGVEPLQYPPGAMHGALKDSGMAALLRGLVAKNWGLCVVTTREKIDEIKEHYGRSATDHELEFLTPLAGAQLLHHSGATRAGEKEVAPSDSELQEASKEVKGHALTLALVGRFLRLTEDGDIRRRDRMKLAEADQEYVNDATRPYGHAFKAIEAYETWFAAGDPGARRQLALLWILGLFDRPASSDCLAALGKGDPIPGITDQWAGATEKERKIAVNRLTEIDLVGVSETGAVDCHPLIREYFAMKLRHDQPEAWRAAHGRLFDHLCASTKPHQPDTLPGLQPLYQAVTHGCLAGRQQEALLNVYVDRILRDTGREGFYSTRKLGAIGADLGAVAAFFDQPWSQVSPHLAPAAQSWLLNAAAFRLRALGRLTEALEPLRESVKRAEADDDWKNVAIRAGTLSETALTLGCLGDAVAEGRRALAFAERSGDAFQKMARRTTAADALHQAGEPAEAAALFAEAERRQAEDQPQFPRLYSVRGFQYADLILAPAERAAWRAAAARPHPTAERSGPADGAETAQAAVLAACAEATERGIEGLAIVLRGSRNLLDIALGHLTLARAGLYEAFLRDPDADPAADPIATNHLSLLTQEALSALRAANQIQLLPQALLTAAIHAGALGGEEGAEEAKAYLAEAQRIAERGPMPLFLADVHLHRARLFRDRAELAKAAKLIRDLGYGRRYEELADAEAASVDWPG